MGEIGFGGAPCWPGTRGVKNHVGADGVLLGSSSPPYVTQAARDRFWKGPCWTRTQGDKNHVGADGVVLGSSSPPYVTQAARDRFWKALMLNSYPRG